MDAKKKTSQSVLTTNYLKIYNFLSAIGWFYLLFVSIQTILAWKSSKEFYIAKNLYSNTSFTLKMLLTTAFLEIFHAFFGLVPSNPAVVFPQVFIRWLVIFGVVDNFSVSSKSVAMIALNLAWSVSEIIRYFYYVFGSNSYFLTWCRYNFFIILYPIGAGAEMLAIGYAAKHIKPLQIRSFYSYELPNHLNVSFDLYWAFCAWISLYFPGFPFMYNHMFLQRKKVLNQYKDNSKKKEN